MAHRDENSEHTCRERSSINHRQLQGIQLVDRSEEEQDLRSPSWRFLMNPAGLPFFAGRIVTLRISPGFIEVLLIPSRVRVWYGGGGQFPVRDLALDLLVRDRELDARVRIRKVQLLEPALRTTSLFRSYTPATAWWACTATPAIRNPHRVRRVERFVCSWMLHRENLSAVASNAKADRSRIVTTGRRGSKSCRRARVSRARAGILHIMADLMCRSINGGGWWLVVSGGL